MATKEELKEAVSESLLEALKVAEEKQKESDVVTNSGLNWVLNLLNKLMPMALLALMGWIALTIVDNQKDLLAMRLQVNAMDNTMKTFMDKDMRKSATSALLHHSTTVNPCSGCHTRNGVVVHTLASLPNKSLMPGDLFEIKCGSCHTLDRVLATKGTHEKWKSVVNEMRQKNAKWISPREAIIIVDYIDQLEKHK
jgi:hypothetical protein